MSFPFSLYVHLPWCVRKCPYCDFNSHALKTDQKLGIDQEQVYLKALEEDLAQSLQAVWGRTVRSIFFGGGTPSLFSPHFYEKLLSTFRAYLNLSPDLEITMEANPGAIEHGRFRDYASAGINRISLGVQSFQEDKLKVLGRIHNQRDIFKAVEAIQAAPFRTWNIDLMHGLPQQSIEDALFDLEHAIRLEAPHLSWYQLTLEPNTLFYAKPPQLPEEDQLADIEEAGFAYLKQHGLQRYEISAFAKTQADRSQHNQMYWTYQDYLGIGAGAHSKITDWPTQTIYRTWREKHPKRYLDPAIDFVAGKKKVTEAERIFEFMLNQLRLVEGFDQSHFEQQTFLPFTRLEKPLEQALRKDLLLWKDSRIQPTELGLRFYNDMVLLFEV